MDITSQEHPLTTKYYCIIEVDKTAPPNERKRAYCRKGIKLHLDKGSSSETDHNKHTIFYLMKIEKEITHH